MITVLPLNTKIDFEAKEVNVTSKSNDMFRALSPFILGPCELADGRTARNVENGWQFSKVFDEHVGDYGNVDRKAYKKWSATGMNMNRAVRYPLGKGNVALFSLLHKKRLTYIEARRAIYIPLYVQCARATSAYKKLEKMVKKHDVVIRDFDAYDHRALNMSYMDVVLDPRRKMGHGFVLAMMLEMGPDNLLRAVGADYAVGLQPADSDKPPWE